MPDRPPARLWTISARVDLGLLESVTVSVSVSVSVFVFVFVRAHSDTRVCPHV